jgi:hypothetical protein
MDTGTVETVIPVNRPAVLSMLLQLMVVLSALGWWSARTTRYGVFGTALAGVIVLYIVWPAIRACFTGVAVVFTERGVVNFTGGVTFVAWHEIEDARIGVWHGTKQVDLVLRDQDAVLQRLGWLRGSLTRSALKRYGAKPSIQARYAKGGAEAVLAEVLKKLGVHRDAV